MKKIISIMLSIALIMTMGICAFAYETPTDPYIIPSTFGTESTVDTSSSDWISAYSGDTTWTDAWYQYIRDDCVNNVYLGNMTQDDLNSLIVDQIEGGQVSKDTINSALDEIIEFLGTKTWGAEGKPKGDAYRASIASLREVVETAEEPADGGDSGDSGSDSTDTYTAEEYGQKIVDALADGSVSSVASMVVSDLIAGKIDPSTIPGIISYVQENSDDSAIDTDAVDGIVDFLNGLYEQIDSIGGGDDIDFDPSSLIPSGGDGDISLPDLSSLGDLFGNFDLGSIGSLISGIPIIGPIIAGLFGLDDGSDGSSNGGGSSSGDSTWNDTSSDDFSNNNTGDTSFIAVGAVALVAGAALILTRKKNEEE